MTNKCDGAIIKESRVEVFFESNIGAKQTAQIGQGGKDEMSWLQRKNGKRGVPIDR